MKTTAWILAIISLTISACTSQKHATTYVNDDVYSSPARNAQVQAAPAEATNQPAQVVTTPDKSAVQKPPSSTLEEDYNDYSYSSRINRFNNKDTTIGYFDEAHSGSSGGTQHDNGPNVNVYLGNSPWYGGYYGPSLSFGMGWGSPYSYWGWDYGWGYPYYGGYYGYGWGYPYYYGYYPWYDPWYNPCCYCYGYNEWYNPYYSSDTYYYGSRRSLYRSDGGTGSPNVRSTTSTVSVANGRNEKSGVVSAVQTTQPSVRSVPAGQEKYRYTRPVSDRQSGNQRSTVQGSGKVQSQTTRQQPAPRYTRPEASNTVQRSEPAQSYSSPVYRQPKSSQEYLAPRSQNPGTNTRVIQQNTEVRSGSGQYNTGTRQNTAPVNRSRSNTTPVRSGSPGYTAPTRTNSNYNAPSRSGSRESYSPPSNSNSGGSYSAPARSGGSSGGSSGGNSGSSGGSGRRR